MSRSSRVTIIMPFVVPLLNRYGNVKCVIAVRPAKEGRRGCSQVQAVVVNSGVKRDRVRLFLIVDR